MNRLDDELLNEFHDEISQLKNEFGLIESQPAMTKKTFRPTRGSRITVAAAIIAVVSLGPSLFNSNSEDNVGGIAWAAVPTELTDEQKKEILNECLKVSKSEGDFEILVTDNRVNSGYMFLSKDRGANFASESRIVRILCTFNESVDGYNATETFKGWSPTGYFLVWGGSNLGEQKIWTFASSINPLTKRVTVVTDKGQTFDASINGGVALAWWPRVNDAKLYELENVLTNNSRVDQFDGEGNLVESFSFLTGKTTKFDVSP